MNYSTTESKRIQIGFNKYSFFQKDILGKGATGYVYKGIRKADELSVAIKAINLISEDQNQITRALLQSQKKALEMLRLTSNNNLHVLKLYDIIYENNYCYIVSQFCGSKTLKDYLHEKKNLTEEEAHQIFRKILIGYCSIIDSCIIHRDLKPANIMMREKNKATNKSLFQTQANKIFQFDQISFEPVIIDFGFCEIIKHKTTMTAYNVGSPTYMSPQAYLKTLYSQKSDMWALGVILFQMITGETPDQLYPNKDIKMFFQSIKQKNGSLLELLKFMNKQSFKLKQLNFSSVTQQLLQSSLKLTSSQRCSSHKLKYILDKQMIHKLNSNSNNNQNKNIASKPKSSACFKSCVYNNFCTKSSNHFQFESSSSSSVLLQSQKNQLQPGYFQKFMINSKSRNALVNSIQKIQPNQTIQIKSFNKISYQNQNRNEQSKNIDKLRLSSNFEFKPKLTESRYKQKKQNYSNIPKELISSNIPKELISSQHKYTFLPTQYKNIDQKYPIFRGTQKLDQQIYNNTEKNLNQKEYISSMNIDRNKMHLKNQQKENFEIYNRIYTNKNNCLTYQNKQFNVNGNNQTLFNPKLEVIKNPTNPTNINALQNAEKLLKSSLQKDYRAQQFKPSQKYFSFKNNSVLQSQYVNQQPQFSQKKSQLEQRIPIKMNSFQKDQYQKFENNEKKYFNNFSRSPIVYNQAQNLPKQQQTFSQLTSMNIPNSTYNNFGQNRSPVNPSSHFAHQSKFIHLRL